MMIRDMLRSLAPIIGEKKIGQIWRTYLISSGTDRRELESLIESYAASLLNDHPVNAPSGLFPPPEANVSRGDLELGSCNYGGRKLHDFGLRKDELLRHVGIYGSSGSGKSNAIALILDGLHKIQIPYVLIDFKRTYRALLSENAELLVFTAGDESTAPFRFNPLVPPPGVSTEVWSRKVIGALSHAYCQGAGSESLLKTAFDEAYLQAGKLNRWPTLSDVSRILDESPARGRKGMWLDSARRAVTSLSTGSNESTFCAEEPIDLLALLERSVVLEMELLSQSEQTFMSEMLLLWIIQYRMNNNQEREQLSHAIVIEEAHHLLRAPPGVGDGSEPVIHTALREVRELGESVILATQTASLVPVQVFGNQATTIAFHTKHQKDVHSTAQAMLLKDEAKEELGRLPVGEAIIRVPRHSFPIHLSINYRPIDKGSIQDIDIRQHMFVRWYSKDSGPVRPPLTVSNMNSVVPHADNKQTTPMESPPSQDAQRHAHLNAPTTPPKERQSNEITQAPTGLELQLLIDIVSEPFDGVVKRIDRAQTSRRKGTAALKSLVEKQLIEPVAIWNGKALLKLYGLTATGRDLCLHYGYGPLPNYTEGGVEHRYYTHLVANQLRQDGWCVETERDISNDLRVDIHAEKVGSLLAVLVETGKSNVKRNIERTIVAGYGEIWVVSTNPAVKRVVGTFKKENGSTTCIIFRSPSTVR